MGEPAGRFDPAEAEPRWIDAWAESGSLRADPASDKPPFTIAIPPPNVTGALHMGHALNNTIQDVLIRRRRMEGAETMWICGTDHAGIATQAVVEKQLVSEGLDRREMGREAFEERVWEWKGESGGTIISQLKRLGATLDYSRERFTMDDAYADAVARAFVAMYDKGWIYRDDYMVNWDPGLRSAISDLEVENREVEDTLVEIAYPLSDGSGEIVVATVRPETMLGDTAVAVHPEDERYGALVGATCTLPLTGREIPIIADDYIDPEFGTGALKVTPAHDINDFEMGRRHDLEAISVIGEDGLITDAAPEAFRGMRVAEASAAVTEALRAEGCVRGESAYVHSVPFSHRSGERVEPLISLQWFADMTDLAAPAIAAGEEGRVCFTPETWGGVYLNWLREIRPWCLSRQLWWGHQLPVWYRGEEIHVGLDAPEGDGWERDPDVLDTWFSSALWPFATLGWPEQTPELEAFYPTQVLSTARDIIFLWVARMVMMGVEFMGTEPFSEVYIHSVIQAPDGRRMSKSLGTGIDPIDVIEEHGADALRFGVLYMSSAQDARYNDERVQMGRQLVTKIWNATSLVIARGGKLGGDSAPRTAADRWMAARLEAAVGAADAAIAGFDFSGLADGIYHTIFDDFADWYLELLKADEATPDVAAGILEQLLTLAHPLIPFITEECHARLSGSDGLLMHHAPPASPAGPDAEAEAEIEALQAVVRGVRAFRAENDIAPREPLRAAIEIPGSDTLSGPALAALARTELVPEAAEGAQAQPIAGGRLLIEREGGVDTAAETTRLEGAIASAEKERARAEKQLANERFVERAPAELVEAEREKAERYAAEIDALRAQLDALGSDD